MAGSLSITNNFSLNNQGQIITGQQGAITTAPTAAFVIATTGTSKYLEGTLATATVVTAYNAANDFPATFIYAFYWADQVSYIQLVGSATNCVLKVAATQLAAASTSIITGGSEPAVETLAKIVLGNYSGVSMNYILAIIL